MQHNESLVVDSFLPKKPAIEQANQLQETTTFSLPPLVQKLREGFRLAEFQRLQDLLLIPEEELARYLGISSATLHRRKKQGQLETPESERIVRFERLFGLGVEVFGSQDATREWLKTPNPGTATESPLSYADTEFGAREVENLLGRIDYGVFS